MVKHNGVKISKGKKRKLVGSHNSRPLPIKGKVTGDWFAARVEFYRWREL